MPTIRFDDEVITSRVLCCRECGSSVTASTSIRAGGPVPSLAKMLTVLEALAVAIGWNVEPGTSLGVCPGHSETT